MASIASSWATLIASISCLFILISAMPAQQNPNRIICPATKQCSCNYIDSDFEVDCPPFNTEITVRVQPKKYVQIECQSSNEMVYEKMPAMQLGNISMVRFRRCPLPASGSSFHAVLGHLGIRNTRTLLLSNGGSSLVRQHLSGFKELERLIINNNGLEELPEDLFDDVTNITWLDLRSNSVHLPVNIFRGLTNLEYLELGYNSLKSLKPGLFKHQQHLKYLNLWGNELKHLTRAELEGVSSVQELDLSANELQSLEPGVFDELANLTLINLSSNKFQSLPEGLFAENTNLTRVRFVENHNEMETLPARFFANLSQLQHVDVTACGLITLPEDLFEGSVNVKNVTFTRNHLKRLPSRVFDGMTRLLDLDLSHNRLQHLDDGLFESLESVLVLRLSHNQLEIISETLLGGLRSLEELHLDHNNLRTIHQQAFRTTSNLFNLQLQHNQLSFVTEEEDYKLVDSTGTSAFHHLNSLRILNLRNNSIISILMDWTYINIALEHLDLSYNNITIFGTQEMQFTSNHDITVNLTHNAISEINFNNLAYEQRSPRKSRTNIYLDFNPLVCDCLILRFVKYLHGQTLADGVGNMRVFPGEMQCAGPAPMVGKRVSDLRPNELICPLDSPNSTMKQCPLSCECFVRPEDLALIVNCSNTNIYEIPSLPIPTSMGLSYTELYVENNKLTALPLVSRVGRKPIGYDFVAELHASHNNISQLNADNIPANLRMLNVQHNNLIGLNQSVLAVLNQTKNLNKLSLSHNPWFCDCSAKDFLLFTQNHHTKIDDMSAIRCTDSSRLQENTVSDLCPEDQTILLVTVIMLSLLAVCICLVAVFYYKYQHEVKVWLFAHKMFACLVTNFDVDSDKKYDAFVSYSHKDQDFVSDHLVPELEKGSQPFKLCLHERDWLVGGAITQSIAESVENSRRTLIVLTKNFVESDWGKMEFRVAHKKALNDNRARVIVIVCGDIQDIPTESLGAEMKAYLETNTYIKWGDPWFWKKLRYALPHANSYKEHQQQHSGRQTKERNGGMSNRNGHSGSVDDKLDLIKPVSMTPPPLTTPPAEMAGQKFMNGMNGTIHGMNGSIHGMNGSLHGMNGSLNGHINGAFIINTNAKQSDV